MVAKFAKFFRVSLVVALVFGLLAPSPLFADTSGTLRPTADGGNDSASWNNTGNTACNAADCYTEVDEASGSSCTNSDGDSSYVASATDNASQTFDVDESSIPNDATITALAITLCYRKEADSPANDFQTRRCIDGSCANSGTNITAEETTYVESTQNHTGLNITKTSSTDIEIGATIQGTNTTKVRVSQISVVVTYTPAPDTTAPAAVTNLALSNPTTSAMTLTWTAPGDDGNTGTATSYDMRYSTSNIDDSNWGSASQATGEPTPQAAGLGESMTVSGLSTNTSYYFALKTSDEVPNTSGLSNVPSKATLASAPGTADFGDVTETSIVVNWTASGNRSGTEYLAENTTAGANSGWITGTSWTSSALTAGSSYSFQVKARNRDSVETSASSLGSKSTAAAATPTPKPTPKPTPVKPGAAPQPVGPTPRAPTLAPTPKAAGIGAAGTTDAELSVIGGTTTATPILPTPGDKTAPRIVVTKAPERIIKGNRFSLSAQALDDQAEIKGVIEYLGYSLDGGVSWHPVSSIKGLGTEKASFEIVSFPLADADYGLLIRSRDNSENETTHPPVVVTIDLENPKVISVTAWVGSQEIIALSTVQLTVSSQLAFELIVQLTGGPTEVNVTIGRQQFALKPLPLTEFWHGPVNLTKTGNQGVILTATDGAQNRLVEELFTVAVAPPLRLGDGKLKTNERITIHEFNDQTASWQIFNATAYRSRNPSTAAVVSSQGIVLPAGRYYLKAGRRLSNVVNLAETSALTGALQGLKPSTALVKKPLKAAAIPQEVLASITTDRGETIATLRGRDVIIFNFNPTSFVALEQLASFGQLGKEQPDKLTVIAVVPALFDEQARALARRGDYELQFSFDRDSTIQKQIFDYRSPVSLFLSRVGTPVTLRSGFLPREQVDTILREVVQ